MYPYVQLTKARQYIYDVAEREEAAVSRASSALSSRIKGGPLNHSTTATYYHFFPSEHKPSNFSFAPPADQKQQQQQKCIFAKYLYLKSIFKYFFFWCATVARYIVFLLFYIKL